MLTSIDPTYQTVSVYQSCACAICKELQARWFRRFPRSTDKIFSQQAIFAGLASHSSLGNFLHLGWVIHWPHSIRTRSRDRTRSRKTPFLLGRTFRQYIQPLKMTYRTLRWWFPSMALQRHPKLGHGSAKSWKMLKGFCSVFEGF